MSVEGKVLDNKELSARLLELEKRVEKLEKNRAKSKSQSEKSDPNGTRDGTGKGNKNQGVTTLDRFCGC